MSTTPNNRSAAAGKKKRRAFAVGTIGAGVLASAALALSLTGTMSSFVASITNTANTAGSGVLTMQETNSDGSVICNSTDGGSVSTNAASCSTINKFGGNLTMVPGQSQQVTVKIKNTGTVAANTFTLTPGAATQTANGTVNGTATDLAAKLDVQLTQNGTSAFNGTVASLAAGGPITLAGPVAPGQTATFVFNVTLDSSAGNAYQGLQVSEPLTWTFTS